MSIRGQWIAPYTGSNTGRVVIDVDEIGDHYEGTAVAWDAVQRFPNSFVRIHTLSKEPIQVLPHVTVIPIDNLGNFVAPSVMQEVQKAEGLQFPSFADVEIKLKDGKLEVEWKTEIGTFGNATATPPKTRAGLPSEIKPHTINTWEKFKGYVNRLERNRYIFRGQESSEWRLQTSFYRAGRANLDRYQAWDVNNDINKLISGLLQSTLDLKNPQHFLAALSLAQHHGYPTPLLDWTWSPYVAAFFAFRNIRSRKVLNSRKKVRVFKFDRMEWNRIPVRADKMFPFSPHITLLDPLVIGNNRAIPQQSHTAFSNVDDIESHILEVEATQGRTFLEVFEFPVRERDHIMQELALMGVTAGSLLPGLDGAFESLREKNFT